MKLLVKTSLIYFLLSVPIVIIGGYFCYSLVTTSVNENTDEELWREKLNAEKIIQKNDTLTKFNFGMSYMYTIKKWNAKPAFDYKYSDTTLYDRDEKEILPYRTITSIYKSNHGNYIIAISKARLESEDLIESILISMLMLIGSLLGIIFLVNWFVSKKTWKPFYKTLDQLKSFNFNSPGIHFGKASTKEFNQLNNSLNEMITLLLDDYKSQKQFTENASHEIQTPLAIVQSKVELLIQSKNLGDAEMKCIEAIYNATHKLSQLNKTLLLLTKIENNQFDEHAVTDLKAVILESMSDLTEFTEAKKLTVNARLAEANIKMPKVLAGILITNLLQNAIKHNNTNGEIKIELSPSTFVIANTGAPIKGDTGKLFDRFTKFSNNHDSVGLGLSIVKSICDKYKLPVTYAFLNNMHTITINL